MLMPSRKRRRRNESAHNVKEAPQRKGPGRPMKRPSDLTLPRKLRTQQAAVLHEHLRTAEAEASKKAERLSALERLPVELLHHIFFYCLDLNLPKASTHLARTLSNSSIYSALILLAYFDDDGETPVEKHHFLPAEYRQISIGDRVKLQDGILRCKWCTLDLLRSRMPVLSRLQMVQAWHRERIAAEEDEEEQGTTASSNSLARRRTPAVPHSCGDVVMDGRLLSIIAFAKRMTSRPALDDKVNMEKYFLAKADSKMNQDPQQRPSQGNGNGPKTIVGPTDEDGDDAISSDSYLPRIISRHTACNEILADQGFSVIAARAFPEHLLRGNPWTEEKLAMLQLLRQGMRFLAAAVDDETTPTPAIVLSPQAMYEGMGNAMCEGNDLALLVLLELFDSIKGGSSRTSISLPVWLFHLAVAVEEGKDKSKDKGRTTKLLALLLRADMASVPVDDAVLTRWATHAVSVSVSSQSQEKRGLAALLLSYMETHDQGVGGSQRQATTTITTTRGRGRGQQGAYELSTVPFAEEIGYMVDGAAFQYVMLAEP